MVRMTAVMMILKKKKKLPRTLIKVVLLLFSH